MVRWRMSDERAPDVPGASLRNRACRVPTPPTLSSRTLVVSDPAAVAKTGLRPGRSSVIGHTVGIAPGGPGPDLLADAAARAPGLHPRAHLQPAAAAARRRCPRARRMIEKQEPAKPVTPDPEPETPKFTAEIPKEEPLKPEAACRRREQAGSATGSDIGVPEGMEERRRGRRGGRRAGRRPGRRDRRHGRRRRSWTTTRPPRPDQDHAPAVPAGGLRQEDRGHGRGRDPDRLHRPRRQGARGAVDPALDAAALQTVQQWVFSPAIKNGRPVATVASAPVTFRIF